MASATELVSPWQGRVQTGTGWFLSWWAEDDPRLGELQAQELGSWQTAWRKLFALLQPGLRLQGCLPGPAASWELSQH